MMQIRRFISLRHLISDLRIAVIKRLYTLVFIYNLLSGMLHFFSRNLILSIQQSRAGFIHVTTE